MSLPEGTKLTYVLNHEAWYADANRETLRRDNGTGREISGQVTDHTSITWEFTIRELHIGERAVLLEVFDESWPLFTQVPDLFSGFAELGKDPSLDEIAELLDAVGFTDVTPRRNPYAPQG